jgi:hypothetical protein
VRDSSSARKNKEMVMLTARSMLRVVSLDVEIETMVLYDMMLSEAALWEEDRLNFWVR